jgi:preprotein translocase SecE subunit
MAIVRTTPKETNTTGAAPPAVKPKASAQTPQRVAGRAGLAQRASQPATSAERGQFFSDVRTELRRVVWPSRETVRSGVIVTIGLLIFFAIYIFGLDVIAERLLGALFSSGSPR